MTGAEGAWRIASLASAVRMTVVLPTALLSMIIWTASGSASALAVECPVASPPKFDCRAYELVSPAYTQGFPVEPRAISKDGSQMLVHSLGSFGGLKNVGGTIGQPYDLVRTQAGWTPVPFDASFSQFSNYDVEALSPTFENSIWYASSPALPPPGDVYRGSPASPLTLAAVGPEEPPNVAEEPLSLVGASADLSRAVFLEFSPNQSGGVGGLWPGDTTTSGGLPSLYEYTGTENREPRLVGVSDEHENEEIKASHLIGDCGTYLGRIGGFFEGDAYNAVSESGATVFFSSASGACGASGPPVDELYARIEGKATLAISEPSLEVPGRDCTEACAAAENEPAKRRPGVFAGASLDGSRVFFTTAQPLVNGDTDGGVDLYEADLGDDAVTHKLAVERLVQVSRGGAGDPTPGSGAEVLGVARVSEDGSHVYFVAEGMLTGKNREGNEPAANAANLYVFSGECPGGGTACANPVERIAFVATLDSARDGADWGGDRRRPVQATPDGRFLVFQSAADLTRDQQERQEAGQVFEYDARTETLVRVSRGQNGYNGDGNSAAYAATIPVQDFEVALPTERFTHLAVSEDGSRVFFSSEDALTPQALSGVNNVYEYHDGQVGLISDGHDLVTVESGPAVELVGTDESGLDVFFTSADRLVPQDIDTETKVYDARVEGGFPPPALMAPCSGDSCQGSPSAPPQLPAPGVLPVAEEAPALAGPVKKASPKKKQVKHRRKAKKVKGRKRGRKAASGRWRSAATSGRRR